MTFQAGWHSQETLGKLAIAKHKDMVSLLMKCQSSTEFWRHTCFLQECGLSLGSHDTRKTVSDSHRLGIPAASSTACPSLSCYSPPPPVEMFSFCHSLHLDLSSPHPRIWDTEDLKIAGLCTDPHTPPFLAPCINWVFLCSLAHCLRRQSFCSIAWNQAKRQQNLSCGFIAELQLMSTSTTIGGTVSCLPTRCPSSSKPSYLTLEEFDTMG